MNHRNALLASHVGALMFGLSGIFGKLTSTTALNITFGRALFAVLALAAVACALRRGPCPSPRRVAVLSLGGLLLGGHWIAFFVAVKIGGVAIATLGFASFPAFTVLLEGVLFRESISLADYLKVALVSLGLLLVTPSLDLGSDATLGLLAAILSGLLFALLSLLNRASTRGVDPVQAALWQNLAILVCLLPFAGPAVAEVPARDWLWLAMLGIFCTGLAHSLFVASLRVLNARTTAVILAIEPVYGISFAWWLFGEQPNLRMLAGGVLIILASVLSGRRSVAAGAITGTG
jgi:drug/metabolite transporter (DMT)-like permease